MTYQHLLNQLDYTKEQLIKIGVVELIILHLLLRIDSQQQELIRTQQVDRFVHLLSLQEAGVRRMTGKELHDWLIRQLILLSVEDPARQETLLQQASSIQPLPQSGEQAADLTDGNRIARVCVECGFKEMVYPPQVMDATIDCPLCGQHTCVQAK